MYIVTGGAGFIGSWIVRELNDRGEDDIIIVDHLGENDKYKNLIGTRYADYLDKKDFISLIETDSLLNQFPIDAVFHMGASSSTTVLDASYLMENNYRYTQILANWTLSKKARFIYASSAATYGNGSLGYSDECELLPLKPLNPYGYSKHAFDIWADKYNLLDKIAGLKFFNVYGPQEEHKDDMRSVISKAYKQILADGKVKLFKSHREDFAHGQQLRDFVYIKDCVKVMFYLLENKQINGLFNVGTGEARSFKDLVTATFLAMNREPNIEYIDMPETIRNRYQYYTQAEMEKIKRTGFDQKFYSLEEGVTDYVQNYLMKDETIG